ncbi:MAG: SPFH domain-containing protein [Anaerolineales bacterium]
MLLIVAAAIVVAVFWILPGLFRGSWAWIGWLIRWIEVLGGALVLAWLLGNEIGERRWLFSTLGHYFVILFGWLADRWLGVIFISFPLIFLYYLGLYETAHILLPASNPEDKRERWQRFLIFVSYTWGIQLPLVVVGEHAWKKPETRIPGDFTRDLPFHGLVWTKAHQAVAITGGNQFKRIDGPGIVFTGKLERPLQIIDLRLQLRTSEIDVVSKDGLNFKARVFTAFRIDNENWDEATFQRLYQRNPLLKNARQLDYTEGSFHFSRPRVLATISVTGAKVSESEEPIFWDRWALNVVEKTARKVVAEKTLDELWRPAEDKQFANALEVIAREIKEQCAETLRAAGILLYAARIVNFSFPASQEIEKQQIAFWGARWARKRTEILARAQAESEKMQQEARAYAQAMLLEAIAEGLQKTQEIHPGLPRYVIAMRFLNALQDFIHRRAPGEAGNVEAERRISDLQAYLREWQGTLMSGSDKG